MFFIVWLLTLVVIAVAFVLSRRDKKIRWSRFANACLILLPIWIWGPGMTVGYFVYRNANPTVIQIQDGNVYPADTTHVNFRYYNCKNVLDDDWGDRNHSANYFFKQDKFGNWQIWHFGKKHWQKWPFTRRPNVKKLSEASTDRNLQPAGK